MPRDELPLLQAVKCEFCQALHEVGRSTYLVVEPVVIQSIVGNHKKSYTIGHLTVFCDGDCLNKSIIQNAYHN